MQIILKTFFLAVVVFILYKIIGVKKIYKLNIFDVIIIFLIANQFILIINNNVSFTLSFFVVLILFILQFSLWIFQSKKNNSIITVYKKRKFYLGNCFKYNVTIFDFIELLKRNKLDNFKGIQEIVLDGKSLRIVNEEKEEDIVFLITDGTINYSNLSSINKNKDWLINNIDCELKDVVCGFYKDKFLYVIKNN